MSGNLVIAIDGHSACGKSTLAKDLADSLGLVHIDSGAMYRAVGLYLLEHGIDPSDEKEIIAALPDIQIEIERINGAQHLILNGKDVETEIRKAEVTEIVSEVAAVSPVRKKLVQLQRKVAEGKDVVMDGRDIGTVVFPNARVKIFLTASRAVRTARRQEELKSKGIAMSREEVYQNLLKRDRIDSTRKDSPLKVAEDAIVLDNSLLSHKEQLSRALKIVRSKTRSKT